jgi:hypothetical protein
MSTFSRKKVYGREGLWCQLTAKDNKFFAAVTSTMKAHQAESRFGLRFYFPFLHPMPGEYLVEETYIEDRQLVFNFENESEFEISSAIETSWGFCPIELAEWQVPLLACRSQRTTYCQSYCRERSRGGTQDHTGVSAHRQASYSTHYER